MDEQFINDIAKANIRIAELALERNEAVRLLKLYLATAESGKARLSERGKKLVDVADIDDMVRAFLARTKG